MISKIIVIIALLINSAQSEILRRKVNSIEEPIVEQGSEIQDSAALEAIEPIGQEASQPLDIYDEGESTKPQIGAMIGLEWEIRGIQVTVRYSAQTSKYHSSARKLSLFLLLRLSLSLSVRFSLQNTRSFLLYNYM